MKRVLLLSIAALFAVLPVSAQSYGRVARPLPPSAQRERRPSYDVGRTAGYGYTDYYFGLSAGLSVSSIHSNSSALDGGKTQGGVFLGFTGGVRLTPFVPLYGESGLVYVEKGGKSSTRSSGGYTATSTYDLNYLEIPAVLRYKYYFIGGGSLEPFFGMYFACGVGGKIRNYEDRVAYSSFGGAYADAFRRFDTGLRLGCGCSFLFFHVQAAYEAGLANIGKDDFDSTRNGCFMLSFGFNF